MDTRGRVTKMPGRVFQRFGCSSSSAEEINTLGGGLFLWSEKSGDPIPLASEGRFLGGQNEVFGSDPHRKSGWISWPNHAAWSNTLVKWCCQIILNHDIQFMIHLSDKPVISIIPHWEIFLCFARKSLGGWNAFVAKAADRALAHPKSTTRLVQAARPLSLFKHHYWRCEVRIS